MNPDVISLLVSLWFLVSSSFIFLTHVICFTVIHEVKCIFFISHIFSELCFEVVMGQDLGLILDDCRSSPCLQRQNCVLLQLYYIVYLHVHVLVTYWFYLF